MDKVYVLTTMYHMYGERGVGVCSVFRNKPSFEELDSYVQRHTYVEELMNTGKCGNEIQSWQLRETYVLWNMGEDNGHA